MDKNWINPEERQNIIDELSEEIKKSKYINT